MVTLDGKEVVDIMIDGVDSKDAPDFCDAFICDATWAHSGYPLDEMAIYRLQDQYPELVIEMAMESLYGD
jgi:hypothetical protein